MNLRIHPTTLLLGLVALAGGCEVPTGEQDVCEVREAATGASNAGVTVTGKITSGATLVVPKTLPLEVKGKLIETTVLIERLEVGGVLADATKENFQEWTAKLGDADLERSRDGDEAKIDVIAYDLCGAAYAIDHMSVPLWPSPGVTVADLDMTVEPPPGGECSLPASGNVGSVVRVTASAASLGGKVTLRATRGTFASSGAASVDLVLHEEDGHIGAHDTFLPNAAGTAFLTASADGSTQKEGTLLITAAPEISGTTDAALEGQTYQLQIRTFGNLDSCYAQSPQPKIVTFQAVSPPLGVIDGVTKVKASPLECSSLELLRVNAVFGTPVAAGTKVSLHCFDTWGQEVTGTLTVAAPKP